MAETAIIVTENPFHKVPARLEARKTIAKNSLRAMIQLYGEVEVRGKAPNTLEAKARDLTVGKHSCEISDRAFLPYRNGCFGRKQTFSS